MPRARDLQGRLRSSAGAPALLVATLALACGGDGGADGASEPASGPVSEETPMDEEHPQVVELARVITEHADEWLAIPGVEGAAVGLLDDGRTPCVQILVERLTDDLRARLPERVDGHPVVLVESGEIRPYGAR